MVEWIDGAGTVTPTTRTDYKYITIAADGVPYLAGTTMKLVELVTSVVAYGWSVAQLQEQFPQLTMGQIHSGLAYYWDNKEALDRDVERRFRMAEEMREEMGETPLVQRLRREGLVG